MSGVPGAARQPAGARQQPGPDAARDAGDRTDRSGRTGRVPKRSVGRWWSTRGAGAARARRPRAGRADGRPRSGPAHPAPTGQPPAPRRGRRSGVPARPPGPSRVGHPSRSACPRSPSLTAPIEACSTRSSPAPIIGREGLLRLLALAERWSAAERARQEGGGSSCPPSPWSPPTADQPGTSDLGAVAAVQPAAAGLAAERGVGPAAGEAERSDRGGRP